MKVGDKVRCIDDSYLWDKHTPKEYNSIDLPRKDFIYTIRNVVGLGVRLVEIRNPIIWHDRGGNKEPSFSNARFVIDISQARHDKLEELGI